MKIPQRPLSRLVDFLLFCAVVVMTCLTFAKESVLYQNNPDGWRRIVYLVATHAYYPGAFLLFCILISLTFRRWGFSKSLFFHAACVLFLVNLALASANNVINILRGRPLHRVHKGIGW